MSVGDKIKVVKEPILRTGEGDFVEYAYQDRIIYYVHLSNGMVVTNPSDFPNGLEENNEPSLVEKEQTKSEACEDDS